MTTTDTNGWAATPLRVHEVPPDDEWLISSGPVAARGSSRLVRAELALLIPERAQVLYFDHGNYEERHSGAVWTIVRRTQSAR